MSTVVKRTSSSILTSHRRRISAQSPARAQWPHATIPDRAPIRVGAAIQVGVEPPRGADRKVGAADPTGTVVRGCGGHTTAPYLQAWLSARLSRLPLLDLCHPVRTPICAGIGQIPTAIAATGTIAEKSSLAVTSEKVLRSLPIALVRPRSSKSFPMTASGRKALRCQARRSSALRAR